MRKRLISLFLILSLFFSLLTVPASASWSDPAFENLKNHGLLVAETNLPQDRYISIIEFMAMVCRAEGYIPAFYEGSTWQQAYLELIKVTKLTDLVNTCSIYGPISRYDAVKILYDNTRETYWAYDASGMAKVFPNFDTFPVEYQEAVAQSYLNGVITGKEDGMFHGWDALTVYEALALLDRNYFVRNRVTPTRPEYPFVIAEFSTIATDVPNRSFNVAKAAESINGTILAPGQQFSFNRVVGKANGANGYKLATTLSGGEYVQGYGGGVCQTATTVFVAALKANLRIDERRNHGLRSTYVDPGWDATIANPYVDLKFSNPYSVPIQLRGGFDYATNTVTFQICSSQYVECPQVEIFSTGEGKEWILHRVVDGVENYTYLARYNR